MAAAMLVVIVVDGNNDDKGMGQQVQGQGMGRTSSLSDLLPCWMEEDQDARGQFESHVGMANVDIFPDDGAPDQGSHPGTSEQTQHLPGGRGYPLLIHLYGVVAGQCFASVMPDDGL
jgi:hypothetical protein